MAYREAQGGVIVNGIGTEVLRLNVEAMRTDQAVQMMTRILGVLNSAARDNSVVANGSIRIKAVPPPPTKTR